MQTLTNDSDKLIGLKINNQKKSETLLLNWAIKHSVIIGDVGETLTGTIV